MDTQQQDVLLGSIGWAPARPKRPTRTILHINNTVTRQGQPDEIAPAAAIIVPTFWALASLVMGVIIIVSQPWEVDMHWLSFNRRTVTLVIVAVVAAITVNNERLKNQERKAMYAQRLERRNAPPLDLNTNTPPRLTRVA